MNGYVMFMDDYRGIYLYSYQGLHLLGISGIYALVAVPVQILGRPRPKYWGVQGILCI